VGGEDANYIAVVADGAPGRLPIVFHEYAHLVVSNVMRNVPSWLSEGLAEYYSTYEVSLGGREAVLGRPIAHHLQRLNETSLMKLEDLLNVGHDSPLYNESDRRSVFYAQSWAMTHRILLGQPSRTAELFAYLEKVSDGTPPVQAWRHAFGTVNMDREMHEYVRRRVLQAVQYKFTEKLARFEATPAALPAADADAFLSDFLLQQDRLDEASARLQSAAKLDPVNPRVQAVMGRLDIERSDYDAAKKRLMSIGDTDDWLLAYSAAVGIVESAENTREAPGPKQLEISRRLFDVVRQQRGEVPNAAARLATLELRSTTGPSSETRRAIERARELAPGREDYAFVHAQVLARLSDFAAARKVLGPLMSGAYGPEVRESARSLMGYIVRMETAAQNLSVPADAATSDSPDGRRSPDESIPSAAATSNVPSGDVPAALRPVFRELQAGEERIEGILERIECGAGGSAVFHIKTATGPSRAAARRMADVEFITYRDDLRGNVSCGPLKPPLPVYLTWRSHTQKADGRLAVAIEFLPK
jgi:tetratricopeptide (TPR) repeat protein